MVRLALGQSMVVMQNVSVSVSVIMRRQWNQIRKRFENIAKANSVRWGVIQNGNEWHHHHSAQKLATLAGLFSAKRYCTNSISPAFMHFWNNLIKLLKTKVECIVFNYVLPRWNDSFIRFLRERIENREIWHFRVDSKSSRNYSTLWNLGLKVVNFN